MKVPTNSRFLVQSSIALTLALAIWFSCPAWSEEPADTTPAMQNAVPQQQCAQMMEKKQKMMEDRKAKDAALTEQIAAMNSAPADQKVDLMAALLTKMVEERVAMTTQKDQMQEEMMAHMMQHTPNGQQCMSQCPMTKGMCGPGKMDGKGRQGGMKNMNEKAADEKAADEHQGHNAEQQ